MHTVQQCLPYGQPPKLQNLYFQQWCSQDQNLKAKNKASVLKAKSRPGPLSEAKVIGSEAEAFKHTSIAEIKTCSTPDSLTGELTN